MTKVSQKHSTKVTEIGGKPVSVLEHQRLRVVTFNMIDQLHNRCDGTARKRFNDHKARFILGEDFFVRNTDEAAEMGFVAPNGLVLLTESGYLMLVKSFNDDLAWQVQRQLVNCYFRASSLKSSRRPSVLRAFNTAIKIGDSTYSSSESRMSNALIPASTTTRRASDSDLNFCAKRNSSIAAAIFAVRFTCFRIGAVTGLGMENPIA